MVVEQSDKSIKIHLDNYVKNVVAEYAEYIKKSLRPKKVPISPGVTIKAEDVPELPNPLKQKYYRSFVAVRYFVCGVTVDTLLRIGRCCSVGRALPSDGISF